jgi:hypothetical protein
VIDPVVDEARFAEAQRVLRVSALRAEPLDDDRCGNCLYYLEPSDAFAFCWHEKLQMLVGVDWWCHFWEMRDDE